MPCRVVIESLQDSLADLLIGDADLSAPQDSNFPTSFPVSDTLIIDAHDDAIGEEEWRQSINRICGEGRRGGGDSGRWATAYALGQNIMSDKELGILTKPRFQRDLIKNDLLVVKLHIPFYEIDGSGKAVSAEWLRYVGVLTCLMETSCCHATNDNG